MVGANIAQNPSCASDKTWNQIHTYNIIEYFCLKLTNYNRKLERNQEMWERMKKGGSLLKKDVAFKEQSSI